MTIDKRIPVAAGLGGGSSDAAAVLLGLNEMLGLGLSRQRLMEEGARLGADVPFFVFGDPAWATGIGDCLEKIDGLPRRLVRSGQPRSGRFNRLGLPKFRVDILRGWH